MRIAFSTTLLLFFSAQIFSQGIQFFEGSWEEALEEATRQNKVIFVDAYASWCGPCKRMAKTVFPDPKAGAFYNQHFINVKLDYEKEKAATFRKKYPVSAFPTLYFIDFDGSVVHQVRGAQSVEGFVQLGELVLTKIDRTGNFEEAYAKGDRQPELILGYIKALNTAGKPSLKVANDYLHNQKDLSTDDNLSIIFEALTEADSRIFDWFIQNKQALESKYGIVHVQAKIENACRSTISKAVEFKMGMLHQEAIEKMEKYYPEKAEQFAIEADLVFYKGTGNPEMYLKACKAYAKKILKEDPAGLKELVHDMHQTFPLDERVQKEAERLEKKIAKG